MGRHDSGGASDLSGKEFHILLRPSPHHSPDHHFLLGKGAQGFAVSHLKLLLRQHKTFAAELNEIFHFSFASFSHLGYNHTCFALRIVSQIFTIIFACVSQNDRLKLPDRARA